MAATDDAVSVVRALASQAAGDHDLELVDAQVRGSGPRTLVRVVVDRDGGVPLDACEAVSRELSRRLDEVDPLPSSYRLEVTSPGVDRSLRDRSAFERVRGREVEVHRRTPDGRVVQLAGVVADADDRAVRLQVGDEQEAVEVGYDEIVTATQRLPW